MEDFVFRRDLIGSFWKPVTEICVHRDSVAAVLVSGPWMISVPPLQNGRAVGVWEGKLMVGCWWRHCWGFLPVSLRREVSFNVFGIFYKL